MDQFKCGPSMVTFNFVLLGGSEFWNFVGPKMNSFEIMNNEMKYNKRTLTFFSSETFIIEKLVRCLFHSWTSTCS